MTAPLRLGIAGLGTVGIGVIKALKTQAQLIEARTGKTISISAVSARNPNKDRGVPLGGYGWESDPVALAQRDDVDVFVELMGGEDGPARLSIEAALAAGKDVVTANKALLAIHGHELAMSAEAKGRIIAYEAAVAGGIPVIKALREGLAGNEITRIVGVMNGSCNYILTRMEETGQSYEAIFAEAEGLGYLEADPQLDVGGIDAAHKLAILSAISFGTKVDYEGVIREGIERVSIADIRHANDLGYKIKLLGVAQLTGRGLEQSMAPCLVPVTSPFGQLSGGTNLISIEGNEVERIVMRGPGAGMGPTASAVLGDICDLARGIRLPTFGQRASGLQTAKPAQTALPAPFYLRLELMDKPGALAKVTAILGEAGISIDRLRQRGHGQENAPVLIITHKTTRALLDQACAQMERTSSVVAPPVILRIETV